MDAFDKNEINNTSEKDGHVNSGNTAEYADSLSTSSGLEASVYPRQFKSIASEGENETSDEYISAPTPIEDNSIAQANPPVFQLKRINSNGMSEETLNKMSNSFGEDFSNVNIHSDSKSAVDVGALAYTQGNDIHFAPGQYDPASSSGQSLLGHELTHIVQQREGRVQANNEINGMPLNDDKGLEQEADEKGAQVAQQQKAETPTTSSKPNTNLTSYKTIQKWDWPWNWGNSDNKDKKEDKDAQKSVVKAGSNTGTNFDTDVGIAKTSGVMDTSMKIKIDFQDTDLKMLKDNILDTDKASLKVWEEAINKLKKDAPDKLKWSDKEKETIKKKYIENIQSVWPSSKTNLFFQLDEPGYDKIKVSNNFNITYDDKSFHHKFAVVKMPPEMGNVIRSYQGGALGGFHDSRTFGATVKRNMARNYVAHQIGVFENNKSTVTPSVSTEINTFVKDVQKVMKEHASDLPAPKWTIDLTGRASQSGTKAHNIKIANNRANTVKSELSGLLPGVTINRDSPAQGNLKTDNSDKYRRVEAVFKDANLREIEQTTMAHETGHMFGYGDEYEDLTTGGNVLPKFEGDESDDTNKAIRDAGMSEEVVKDTRVEQNSESIMNTGNVVGVGHYSLFLIELKKIAVDADTNKEVNWQVIKA